MLCEFVENIWQDKGEDNGWRWRKKWRDQQKLPSIKRKMREEKKEEGDLYPSIVSHVDSSFSELRVASTGWMQTTDIKTWDGERELRGSEVEILFFFYSSPKRNEKLNPQGLHLFFCFYLPVFQNFCSLTLLAPPDLCLSLYLDLNMQLSYSMEYSYLYLFILSSVSSSLCSRIPLFIHLSPLHPLYVIPLVSTGVL